MMFQLRLKKFQDEHTPEIVQQWWHGLYGAVEITNGTESRQSKALSAAAHDVTNKACCDDPNKRPHTPTCTTTLYCACWLTKHEQHGKWAACSIARLRNLLTILQRPCFSWRYSISCLTRIPFTILFSVYCQDPKSAGQKSTERWERGKGSS